MNERLKNYCIAAIIFTAAATVGGWVAVATSNNAKEVYDFLFFAMAATALLIGAIVILVILCRRRDLVPDFLGSRAGAYLNCDGFTFAMAANAVDGIAYLITHFQNQYEGECLGQIALRPERRMFCSPSSDMFNIEIKCDGAAFGTARIPFPVQLKRQGKRQRFEVCASVAYPHGRGRRVRFFSGLVIRNQLTFRDGMHSLTIPGLMAGTLVWSSPAVVIFEMPRNVAESPQAWSKPEITIHWKLGDPVFT